MLFPGDAIGLSADEVTIASLLREQGYATRMVGKWHVGDQREFLAPAHGFDDFLGLPYSNDMHCDLELPPSIGRMPPLMLLRQDRVIEADPNQVSLTDRYLVDALRLLAERRRNSGGVGSNAPLRGGKGQTWEGGVREPFIAWCPGTVPAGAECRELCTTMDLLPTFARMAGVPEPQDRTIDGRDLTPLLTGRPGAVTPHRAFYYYSAAKRCLDAVRSGR